MKQNIFLIGILCMSFLGCAQDNDGLKRKIQLLQYPVDYQFPSDNTGYSKIENQQFYTESGESNFFTINSKNIHLVDFNNDGVKDIVYQNTEHYTATILFENKDNRFTEIASIPGKLLKIEHGEATTFHLLKNFIGCDDISMLIELLVLDDNSISYTSLLFYKETKIEFISKTFSERVVSGILRTRPILDDIEKTDPCTGQPKKGNQIKRIENETVTVIGKQDDWLLVCLEEGSALSVGWIER